MASRNLTWVAGISGSSIQAAHLHATATWFGGDFRDDGSTDLADFALLAAHFNRTSGSNLPRSLALPEPAAIIGILLFSGCIRRRPLRACRKGQKSRVNSIQCPPGLS
ncbi:MAG: hypothetical protein RMJ35_12590 [Phycisphaerales bacterium]|nr:hypothetical protein [Phycisphaerales bacterium]